MQECKKRLIWKGDLKSHVYIHTGEKYDCKEYGKLFIHKRNLDKHKLICSEEKFKCEDYGKLFTQKSHLSKHIYTGKKSLHVMNMRNRSIMRATLT